MRRDLAGTIDHTLLKPEADLAQVRQLCAEALEHGFKTVCINRVWVEEASRQLAGSPVDVCSVVGFPLGATSPTVKAFETAEAVAAGAAEIDMVIALGALRQGNLDEVRRDIESVVRAAGGRIVKVILETCLLDEDQKVAACRLSAQAGAHFVKTSTGFGPGGATIEDVRLMRRTVGEALGVKASGGIRTTEQAEAFIEAGASRLGTSSGIAIVTGG